jgi:hypothetical protein
LEFATDGDGITNVVSVTVRAEQYIHLGLMFLCLRAEGILCDPGID